jgi:hypothetical protein
MNRLNELLKIEEGCRCKMKGNKDMLPILTAGLLFKHRVRWSEACGEK